MLTIGEIRRLRLLQLMQMHGLNFASMNERLGRSRIDSTLSQIVNTAPNSRTQRPRQMGDAQARLLETTFKLPEGWMDRDPEFDALLARVQQRPDELSFDLAEPPPPAYATPEQVLQSMATLLAELPPEVREAAARTLDGWARDPQAKHWQAMMLTLLSSGTPSKRVGNGDQ